jgi:septum formation protein
MGIDFEVRLKPVEEVYPDELKGSEISDYLAQLKAVPFNSTLTSKELLITSDTIVWQKGTALGKPNGPAEALKMLQSLAGKSHEVITSVCLTTNNWQVLFNDITEVSFTKLTDAEIQYYIQHYKPYDKAGSYGIQEWIGTIGIDRIKGSYNNVVGLPTQKLYETLKTIAKGG